MSENVECYAILVVPETADFCNGNIFLFNAYVCVIFYFEACGLGGLLGV